jgi:CRP-like cAMP-binding protein
VAEKIELSTIKRQQLLDQERKMLAELLAIQRIRSADARLIQLLQWIAKSFGQVNNHGCTLSLSELNLTHSQLAKPCGLTRVTATKIFSRFRLGGQLLAVGESDLLIPSLP